MSYQKIYTIIGILFVSIFYLIDSQANTPPHSENSQIKNDASDARMDVLLNVAHPFEIDSDRIEFPKDLNKLKIDVDSVLAVDTVRYVGIKGYASIDGPVALNRRLATERAVKMFNWLVSNTNLEPGICHLSSNGEDWNLFENIVSADARIPQKNEVIDIIRSKLSIPNKQQALKSLQGGKVWSYLADHIFPEMRITEISLDGFRKYRIKVDSVPEPQASEVMEVVEIENIYEPLQETENYYEVNEWIRKLYVKTNAPAWLMLWVNAAFEIDLAPHWSVSLPIYYSGWNYFTSKLKFRTVSLVPEVRWWPKADNMGFFINAHLGMNLFNYAKGGEWRYQTYKGRTPALGGGVGIGFRWYFCQNHKWSMEAAVGAGIYHLDYSIFRNIPNGLIVGREKRTFYGIDQAALSFAYSFGVQRKEVKK